MKSRENYWYWMLQNIKFARYDRKFIRQVYESRIVQNLPITVKQAELWEKLVFKYRTQIQQASLDPDVVLAAAWDMSPVIPPPEPEHYELTLADQHLIMRGPYNAQSVDAWRKYRASRGITDEVWDRETRQWIIPVTSNNFKHTLNFCLRSAQKYQISSQVLDLMDPVLSSSQSHEWTTQARLVNSRIMINCVNLHVLAALPDHLPLTLTTLNHLTRAGVDIHHDLRAYFMQDPDSVAITWLNSQQSTALTWGRQHHQAIIDYIDQHSSDSVVVEMSTEPGEYQDLCRDIKTRWPNRVRLYCKNKQHKSDSSQFWEFFTDQYDYQGIDFDAVDIAINKSRNLVTWDLGALPAQIARKNIYYIDPQHDREDYLDGNTSC